MFWNIYGFKIPKGPILDRPLNHAFDASVSCGTFDKSWNLDEVYTGPIYLSAIIFKKVSNLEPPN